MRIWKTGQAGYDPKDTSTQAARGRELAECEKKQVTNDVVSRRECAADMTTLTGDLPAEVLVFATVRIKRQSQRHVP